MAMHGTAHLLRGAVVPVLVRPCREAEPVVGCCLWDHLVEGAHSAHILQCLKPAPDDITCTDAAVSC
jgi:hypothetical protein